MTVTVGDLLYTRPAAWERAREWRAYKIVSETKGLWELGNGGTVNKKTMLEGGRSQHGYGRRRFFSKAEKADQEFIDLHARTIAASVTNTSADKLRAIADVLGLKL